MLIIPVKEGEPIDKALKKYKRKFDKTKVIRKLRANQQFTKKSVTIRQSKLKAAHKQRLMSSEEI
jgi:small subunit ribosomal protein S21